MAKDLHNEPFDEGTKAKLEIFSTYFKEWLPVFIKYYAKNKKQGVIKIFDFFAGPGKDKGGHLGSPLIIINELKVYEKDIRENGIKIFLYFNEYKKSKFKELRINLEKEFQSDLFQIELYSDEFGDAFENLYSKMQNSANFIFLDQNGIKQITPLVFKKITNLKLTDFIFFISSNYITRFVNTPEFDPYLKELSINKIELENKPSHHVHRFVYDSYKKLIPHLQNYHLGQFSIKKPNSSNIYGLIFGSGHPFGMEKFLISCWKTDAIRGEANFDIDGDNHKIGQIDAFSQKVAQPKKIEVFEDDIKDKIKNRAFLTNRDIYLYALERGFLPTHVNKVINDCSKQGFIKKITTTNRNIHKIIPERIEY